MKTTIANALIHGLKGYNSHLSAEKALEGLTADTAGKLTDHAPNTIWQQIAHINFWQQHFIAHIKGEKLANVLHAADGWPEPAAPTSEKELKEGVNTLLQGIAEAKEILRNQTDLCHPSNYDSGYDVIIAMTTHLSYHLGQIMMLRRILGDYPPPSGGYVW